MGLEPRGSGQSPAGRLCGPCAAAEARSAPWRRRSAVRLGIRAAEAVDDRARAARSPGAGRGFFCCCQVSASWCARQSFGKAAGISSRRQPHRGRTPLHHDAVWANGVTPDCLAGRFVAQLLHRRMRAARGVSHRVVRFLSGGNVGPRCLVIFFGLGAACEVGRAAAR